MRAPGSWGCCWQLTLVEVAGAGRHAVLPLAGELAAHPQPAWPRQPLSEQSHTVPGLRAALTLLSPCPCLGAGGTLNFSLLQPICQALMVQPSLTTKADTTVLYASPSYSWQR